MGESSNVALYAKLNGNICRNAQANRVYAGVLRHVLEAETREFVALRAWHQKTGCIHTNTPETHKLADWFVWRQ